MATGRTALHLMEVISAPVSNDANQAPAAIGIAAEIRMGLVGSDRALIQSHRRLGNPKAGRTEEHRRIRTIKDGDPE